MTWPSWCQCMLPTARVHADAANIGGCIVQGIAKSASIFAARASVIAGNAHQAWQHLSTGFPCKMQQHSSRNQRHSPSFQAGLLPPCLPCAVARCLSDGPNRCPCCITLRLGSCRHACTYQHELVPLLPGSNAAVTYAEWCEHRCALSSCSAPAAMNKNTGRVGFLTS